MSTRGWEHATLTDVRDRRTPRAVSKYRNVKTVIKTVIGGVTVDEVFDSKREAAYWQGLKAREHNGEIIGSAPASRGSRCCAQSRIGP